jgi:hypothetical protein
MAFYKAAEGVDIGKAGMPGYLADRQGRIHKLPDQIITAGAVDVML